MTFTTHPPPLRLPAGSRGLLALDVDGPLNPWRNKPARRPDGYSSFRLTRDGRWYTGREFRRHKGLVVWLNPDHGRRLLDLAEKTKLLPVWATTWLDQANALIAPAVGLPDLQIIRFPDDDLDGSRGEWRDTGRWKYAGVADHAGDLPVAWLDDEHDHTIAAIGHLGEQRVRLLQTVGKARDEFLRARSATSTLLCQVDPTTGLRDDHYDQIRNWATTLR